MFMLLTHLSIELCMSFSFVLNNKLPKKLSAILYYVANKKLTTANKVQHRRELNPFAQFILENNFVVM